MPDYKRFVGYFYEYIDGKRQRNAGFIKVEERNGIWRAGMQLRAAGWPERRLEILGYDAGEDGYDTVLLGKGYPQGDIFWQRLQFRGETVNLKGKSFEQLAGMWIPCGPGRDFISHWAKGEPEIAKLLALKEGRSPEGILLDGRKEAEKVMIPKSPETEGKEGTVKKSTETGEKERAAKKNTEHMEEEGAVQKDTKLRQKAVSAETEVSAQERADLREAEKPEKAEPKEAGTEETGLEETGLEEREAEETGLEETEPEEAGLEEREAEVIGLEETELEKTKTESVPPEQVLEEAKEKAPFYQIADWNQGFLKEVEKKNGEKWEDNRAYGILKERCRQAVLFAGEEACLLLCPGDIQWLGEQGWPVGRNRFLMQGFCQYHHLLLGRNREKGYYLGVPGIGEGRSRVLASSFGFLEFRGAKISGYPRKFGYWCRPIDPSPEGGQKG